MKTDLNLPLSGRDALSSVLQNGDANAHGGSSSNVQVNGKGGQYSDNSAQGGSVTQTSGGDVEYKTIADDDDDDDKPEVPKKHAEDKEGEEEEEGDDEKPVEQVPVKSSPPPSTPPPKSSTDSPLAKILPLGKATSGLDGSRSSSGSTSGVGKTTSASGATSGHA